MADSLPLVTSEKIIRVKAAQGINLYLKVDSDKRKNVFNKSTTSNAEF
jgi:hypothetical protein